MSSRRQSAATPVTQLAQWRGCGRQAGLLLALGAAFALPAHAHDTDSSEEWALDASQSSKGHGSMSIGYQDTLVNGFQPHRGPTKDIGTVRIHALELDVEYFFADRWSVHVGVPFVQSRYHGGFPHCPTRVPAPCEHANPVADPSHPESRFLDDGSTHGTWQDWILSVAYHTNIDNYYLTPSVTALVPSHDYTFFAQSAVGQDLNKLRVGIELAHQFDFTELYYRVDVAHVFAEETLGVSIDSNRLDLELGYFVSPKLTLKTFALYKRGDGIFNDDPRLRTTPEFFYHHDQISKHEYFNVGLGLDYNIDDKTYLSTTAQTLIWGETVYNLRYSIDVRLTRDF